MCKTGGAFFHARNIERELTQIGWRVEIITLDNLPVIFRYLPHLLEKLVNWLYAPLGFLYKAYVTKLLYKLFFDKKADVRVFEDIYLSWDSDIPSVSVLHAVWSDNIQAYTVSEAKQQRFRNHEAKIINKIGHPVVTVSYPYRDYIVNEHFKGMLTKKIDVIELGVDQAKFSGSNDARRLKKSIVYCGTLEARKNLFFLLDLFKAIYEEDSEYSLTIIGDGPDRGRMEAYANGNNLPVRFLGRLDNDNVLPELYQHEIYMHTSVKESFSYSLLEAKMAGLKTCAYAKLQIPAEFIDLGFDTFDVEEWSRGILNIRPELCEFDGSKYTAERMTMSTLNLIQCKVI